jgi:hypothetical protein
MGEQRMQKNKWLHFPIIFTFLVLTLIVALNAGTTGKIRGILTDAKTGEPVAGANVVLQGTLLGGATDQDGIYIILLVPPGTYTLEASMIGYTSQFKEDIKVESDRTITINFALEEAILEGEAVVVVAKRDLVKLDVSASETNVSQQQMKEIPFATRVEDVISLQAGVQGNLIQGELLIREGDASETDVLVDGYSTRDTKFAKVKFPVNQQSIEEVTVLRGGFNAEYGEARSGIVNIITKNPENALHISLDYQYEPPGLRHDGKNYYDRSKFWPYRLYDGPDSDELDTLILYEGVTPIIKTFQGWNSYSDRLLNDSDPSNDLTPQEAHDLWNWLHRPIEYGNVAGHNMDLTLSGGVDILPWHLNILAGLRYENRPYTYPQPQDSYEDATYSLKLINKLSESTNLTLTGLFSNIKTVSNDRANSSWSNEVRLSYDGGDFEPFYPYRKPWVSTKSTLVGMKLLHVVSPTVYLEADLSFFGSYWDTDKYADAPAEAGRVFHGRLYYDPQSGYIPVEHGVVDDVSGYALFGGANSIDNSFSERYNAKLSMVNQFHPSHEIKAGVEFQFSHLVEDRTHIHNDNPAQKFLWKYNVSPLEFSAYVQDKIEFWGMIANLGLRYDYYHVNQYLPDVWRTLDFPTDRSIFESLVQWNTYNYVGGSMPTRKPEPQFYFSPRVGVSFPISESSKVYFNYGHFAQIPTTEGLYSTTADYNRPRVQWLGNAFLGFQKSYNFELGYDQNVKDWFQLHVGAFYKDYSDVGSGIVFAHSDQTLILESAVQRENREVRGLELEIRKATGQFLTGYFNFNITQKSVSDLQVPPDISQIPIITDNESIGLNGELKGIPRPLVKNITPYGRGVVTLSTPENWGPRVWDYPILHKTRASISLYYRGEEYTEHPEESFRIEHPEVKFYRIPYFSSNLRLSRNFQVSNLMQCELYLDIGNLWVSKYRTAIPNSVDYYNDLYANGKTDRVGSEEVSDPNILRTESDVLYAGQHRTYILGLRIIL